MRPMRINTGYLYVAGLVVLLGFNVGGVLTHPVHASSFEQVKPLTVRIASTQQISAQQPGDKASSQNEEPPLNSNKADMTEQSRPEKKDEASLKREATDWVPLHSDLPAHTTLVGSVDNPTLDGGIIHAADGLPVLVPQEKKEGQVEENKKTTGSSLQTAQKTIEDSSLPKIAPESKKEPGVDSNVKTQGIGQIKNEAPFNDSWATSTTLGADLKRASQSGQLPLVLSEAQEMNLPASVALVPLVESRYHDEAHSPKGAGGAWQLMPQTAKDYGLLPEARTNFIAATPAALTLLSSLHQSFGNWTLAFAAYNAGQGRVKAAIKANPSAQSIDELNLPRETKNYVHQLQSLSATI